MHLHADAEMLFRILIPAPLANILMAYHPDRTFERSIVYYQMVDDLTDPLQEKPEAQC